jgi:DNA repair exonuclease SbcCD ATPase subunit
LYVDSLADDTTYVGALIFAGNAPAGLELIRYKVDMENIEYNAELDMQIDELTETRIEFENQIEVNDIEIANIRILQDSIQKLETQSLKFKSIEMDLEKMESLLAKFITYASDIKNNKIINEEIEELQNNIVQLESEYDSIEKKYNIEQMSLSKYSAQIAQFKKDNKERKDLEKVAEQWEYYKNALKQLPYVLLDKIKPILEKKVNDMLSIATDFNVNFDMADNKIDIYLNRSSYNNKQIIVNNASGFERFMASLAIRMALLELSNLPKINFLAIDEGWSSFDTHNINNVNVIMDYLKTKFDFILTISHLTQIKEHCDKQIFLKRDSAQYSVITYED